MLGTCRFFDHFSSPVAKRAGPYCLPPTCPEPRAYLHPSCHTNGSLTLLFLPISRHSKNVLHASSHSASISVTSTVPAASRPRVSLIGNITVFTDISKVPERAFLEECYLAKHRDARWWLPDDKDAAHVVRLFSLSSMGCASDKCLCTFAQSYWARFDPRARISAVILLCGLV